MRVVRSSFVLADIDPPAAVEAVDIAGIEDFVESELDQVRSLNELYSVQSRIIVRCFYNTQSRFVSALVTGSILRPSSPVRVQ